MTEHVKIYGIKPRIQYTADGILTEYEFPFAIFKTSDIDVYFGETKQESSSYTVSEARHSDGGSVTFETAPESGTIITIVRNLSVERTSDFQEGSTLRAKVLNDELDYQIACAQQIADNLNRSMVLPPYAASSNVNLTLPLPSAGKAIVWNSDGTNLENSTVEVNALENTLKGYKTAAETAASTAIEKAGVAADKADIATSKAAEAVSTLASKAEKDFSNVVETDAHQLIGNRVWISNEYDLSSAANVAITHNLDLTSPTKAFVIPYLKFTSATSGYEIGDIISNFSLCGAWYTPGDAISAITTYGSFLNLYQNSVVVPKIVNNNGIVFYHKTTGAVSYANVSNVKIFVKIIY